MVRGCRNRVGPRLVSLFDGPQPAFAKDGTNPFTRKIVEIAQCGGNLARPSDGFAEDHFEMLALILRACRAGKGPSSLAIMCSAGFSAMGLAATSAFSSASIAFPTARTGLRVVA